VKDRNFEPDRSFRGTIITEWDEGYRISSLMLSSGDMIRTCVNKLVEIAVHHRFDGYLLNVENKLNASFVRRMNDFLAQLTRALKAALPHSRVIWYDSVTTSGDLKWQNQLNEHNLSFFDRCDGIFTNYHWKREMPTTSRRFAGGRYRDVFFGIDIWGRGTFGGGEFKTADAVDVAYGQAGCSVALFAPGWTHERFDSPSLAAAANELLWSSIEDKLTRRRFERLPFWSNFATGVGTKQFIDGECVGEQQFCDLRLQSAQMSWSLSRCIERSPQQPVHEAFVATRCFDDAFQGSCWYAFVAVHCRD
jgi:mannosyl-glycoprotein endo-beta-N-acetylglucosaminidase